MHRPPPDTSRRHAFRVAGVAAITAVAGCLTLLSPVDSCSDERSFSLQKATEAGISNEFSTPVTGLAHQTQTVVSAALDTASGESTARGYYSPHPPTEYVVTGTGPHYHHVDTTETDPKAATGYEYAAEIDIDDLSRSGDEETYSFTELPSHDRSSLLAALGNPHLLDAPHYTSFSVVFAYEQGSVRNQSVFVPGRNEFYLEWDDTWLRLTFEGQRTVEISSTTVSTELVADSPAAFVEYIGNDYGVGLETPTSQHRDIITESLNGTYTECKPYSDAFNDIRDQLSTRDGRSVLLVRHTGDWYFVHLSG